MNNKFFYKIFGNSYAIDKFVSTLYTKEQVTEMIDNAIPNYVDDNLKTYDDNYKTVHQLYKEHGKGQAEDEIMALIIEKIRLKYNLSENLKWYSKNRYGNINEIIYKYFPQLK